MGVLPDVQLIKVNFGHRSSHHRMAAKTFEFCFLKGYSTLCEGIRVLKVKHSREHLELKLLR